MNSFVVSQPVTINTLASGNIKTFFFISSKLIFIAIFLVKLLLWHVPL